MKSTRTMIYIMLIVLFAGAIYLFSTGHDDKGILKGIDPESYDIAVTCEEVEGNTLICNNGNDEFLVLSGTSVFVADVNSIVDENGDIEVKKDYSESDSTELEQLIDDNGSVVLHLWMTPNGKIDCVMVVKEHLENNSKSLKALKGFNPDSYNSENVVTKFTKGNITLAPANYSEYNDEKLSEFVKTHKLAENAQFYHMDIKEKVEKDQHIMQNVQYMKYDFRKTKEFFANNKNAYIWFDQNGDVKNIMTVSRIVIE